MSDRGALLDGLLTDPRRAVTVPREEAVALLIELAQVQRALELAVMQVPTVPVERRSDPAGPGLLTVAEAAGRSRKSPRWIRDHWRNELPFGVKRGRTLLFPSKEFEKWLQRP